MTSKLIIACLLALCLSLAAALATAEDTFSIVAVDPATGQVGSAGASCIAGSIIISDVHPGVGAIHTQSWWNAQNQNNARQRMNEGYSPQEIIDWLVANDAQNNPTIRQYGVVDLIDGGRSAGYSGINCSDYKGHNLAPTYAIAGNILLGQEILDDMEAGFVDTPGSLADKLMAALQGANVPGADTRCLSDGKPAISAFIRVARPHDEPGGYYLDLNVNNTAPAQNPIDMLQVLYDEWLDTLTDAEPAAALALVLHQNHPNPFNPHTEIRFALPATGSVSLTIHDLTGRTIRGLLEESELSGGEHRVAWDGRDDGGLSVAAGVYFCRLEAGPWTQTRKLTLLK
jgi:uncharacterized Ntn-hydrolase superfamily protein